MIQPSDITIFLPIYDQIEFLSNCLRGLLNQSWTDFRVIGYTGLRDEESHTIFEKYSLSDERFQLRFVARESVGIEISKSLLDTSSPYVLFLDPGDWLLPDFLAVGMILVEQYHPQMVLFDAGRKEIRFNTMRDDLHMMKREVLPAEGVFSLSDIKGNCFSIRQKPSRLTLFQASFLLKNEIYWPEDVETNSLYTGLCALAVAERVCAARGLYAFLYQGVSDVKNGRKEMASLQHYLQVHSLWEETEQPFASLLLRETMTALQAANNDEARYEILDSLETDPIIDCYLQKNADWFQYKESANVAYTLINARKRYRLTKDPILREPEEQIICQKLGYNPAVSVIIPVYNTEQYLEEAVRSVMNQTLGEIEIICYDDGSTDRSLDILKKLAGEDSRIRVYRQKNYGQATARNRAMNRAKGKYVYYMDSDDCLEASALETSYNKAEADKLDWLVFNAENFYDEGFIGEDTRDRRGKVFCKNHNNIRSGADFLIDTHKTNEFYGSVWLQFVCRDFLIRNNISFHDGIVFEDVPYTYEVMLKAARVAYLDTILYKRRLREGATTTEEKKFYHTYGMFKAVMDMWQIYLQMESRLTEEQRDVALNRLRTVLNSARNTFMLIKVENRGEEYGLRDDCALFRGLVSDYGEKALSLKSAKTNAEKLQKKLDEKTKTQNELKQKLAQNEIRLKVAFARQKETSDRLSEVIAEKKQLLHEKQIHEKQTNEWNQKIQNLTDENQELKKQFEQEKKNRQILLNSHSYKISRFITMPIRQIKRFIKKGRS